ncbi:TetR/AcrR family transcriptional regulator C-terminal domain-containing protein [Rhizobium sp. GN54]|uniref:TetR/AcrR family transcriptional regulator C-terminal domain-containing protein n=1 Tax=Rhizobium sp. GN54 TaxID=2898150 RepID=UPI001E64F794|nr:TetR/AcrR family transcriptional regulator C-terminal domain-containing protein [Rhizobium sp. GN54]MCD2181857.1 TetR/AcrR family transcriptional regulator [Rhizobium sp. GN54]
MQIVDENRAKAERAGLSERQNAVLESALKLLVDGGEKAVTTAGVARAANCSKESLYKWFGDRDGLLSAMISYQAGKVRTVEVGAETLTTDGLRKHLAAFALDLLDVLSGDVSLALNRLAIGQTVGRTAMRGARGSGPTLGRLLEERGRRQIGRRATMLLEAGRKAGLLAFDDADEAYGTLYGLIVTDAHLRMLLGFDPAALKKEFAGRAERAAASFLTLYGVGAMADA